MKEKQGYTDRTPEGVFLCGGEAGVTSRTSQSPDDIVPERQDTRCVHIPYSVDVCSWACYLTSLSFNFLLHKMRLYIEPASLDYY